MFISLLTEFINFNLISIIMRIYAYFQSIGLFVLILG